MGNCLCASAPPRRPPPENRFAIKAVHMAGTPKLSVLKNLGNVEEEILITEKYILSKELGRGEFGITYLCTDKMTKEVLACKSISKRKLRTPVDVEDVRREVTIMRHLPPHPNIVSLKEVYEDDNAVQLIMELCEGGELFDRIVSRGHYNERAAAKVAHTICEVVKVCHEHGVMHRDLKPENFLFADKQEDSNLKVIDFGLSVMFKPGERFSEIVGSPYYMAPEVLKRNYGPEIDVWSAGVIIYILLCGVPPFWSETEPGIAHAILGGFVDFTREPWPSVSNSAKSLIRGMLESDPRRRLTPQQVLDHPWLRNDKQASTVSLGAIVQSRLKQFSAMNKLKKAALRVIVELLSGEEVDGLKAMFDMMDINKSGSITFEQFKNGLRKLGSQLGEHEIRQLMEAADVDKRGTLDYGKFASLTLQLQMLNNDEYLRNAFSSFDKDGNGFIDLYELTQALTEESTPNSGVIRAIMNEVDTDKDERISFLEFKKMMQSGVDWRKVSRHFSRERFNGLSSSLVKDGSIAARENNRSR